MSKRPPQFSIGGRTPKKTRREPSPEPELDLIADESLDGLVEELNNDPMVYTLDIDAPAYPTPGIPVVPGVVLPSTGRVPPIAVVQAVEPDAQEIAAVPNPPLPPKPRKPRVVHSYDYVVTDGFVEEVATANRQVDTIMILNRLIIMFGRDPARGRQACRFLHNLVNKLAARIE